MYYIIFCVCLINDIYRYIGVNKRNISICVLNCFYKLVIIKYRVIVYGDW